MSIVRAAMKIKKEAGEIKPKKSYKLSVDEDLKARLKQSID